MRQTSLYATRPAHDPSCKAMGAQPLSSLAPIGKDNETQSLFVRLHDPGIRSSNPTKKARRKMTMWVSPAVP